ncbi:putative transmembrane protein [Toxoplasma gondii RUB]|uniref:Putative transmembrane protein n=1 Tax=Toxoplasma gondii RUB TaxID=935652 RepID=A0A086LNK2_TOXGO|nr:putative transmembrane protein [Toxoplasma gondii RUB]
MQRRPATLQSFGAVATQEPSRRRSSLASLWERLGFLMLLTLVLSLLHLPLFLFFLSFQTVHCVKDHSLVFSQSLLRQTPFRFYLLDSRAFHSDSKEPTKRTPTDAFLLFLSSSATTFSSTICSRIARQTKSRKTHHFLARASDFQDAKLLLPSPSPPSETQN